MAQLVANPDRRVQERDAPSAPATVQLTLFNDEGSRSIMAQVLSLSYSGIGVICNQPLSPGTMVSYGHPTRNKPFSGRIAWCRANENESYEHGIMNESLEPGKPTDHYAFLQITANAEPDAIELAYRRLGNRYHPENTKTGNRDLYHRVLDAYETLIDAVKRTEYDLSRRTDTTQESDTKVERNRAALLAKRQEMLDLLYWRRIESPYKPIISMHEFETLLNIPKDQMEFNLWFLRERGLVIRSDNAAFVITADGVAAVESEPARGEEKKLEPEAVAAVPEEATVSVT